MSISTAEAEGLVFEGGTAGQYSWNSNELNWLRIHAKEIRLKGFKAKVVKSTKNEWGCGDYVLMVEPEYFTYREAEKCSWMVTDLDKRIAEIRAKAEEEIAKITAEANEIKATCDKYGIKY